MRIAINTRFLLSGKTLEGIGRYTYEIARNLVLSHPEHEFYFFFDRPFDDSYIFAPNVKGITIFPPARHPFLFYLWYEWRLPIFIKKHNIDVFFSPDNFMSLSINCPTVLTVHDLAYKHFPEHLPFFSKWYYRIFMPKFIAKATAILPVSYATAQDIETQFKINHEKMTVVHNALPHSFYQKTIKQKEKENYFVLPGSINPRKNTLKVLQAFELFLAKYQKPFSIRLIGRFMRNPDQSLLQTIHRLQERGLLIHLTDIDDQEMIEVISRARGLLYISKFEGFGIPILEGMACGTAVITSNNSSMPEVAGDAALIVNDNDVNEIADAMIKLCEDEKLHDTLIEKGYKRVTFFDYKVSAEKVYSIIENIVQTHKKRPLRLQ